MKAILNGKIVRCSYPNRLFKIILANLAGDALELIANGSG